MPDILPTRSGQKPSSFSYGSLPTPGTGVAYIRVFNLLPGLLDDSVRGELAVVPFDIKSPSKPKYECLSYNWGNASDMVEIFVDDKSFHVSRRLFTALRQFRLPDRVRTLWADAICIDQENDKEKSEQVGLMHQIYEEATRVLAWLGEAEDGSEKAFALFRRLLTSLGSVGLRKWHSREARGPGSEPQAGEVLPWEYDRRVDDSEQYYQSPVFRSLKPFDVFASKLQEWLPEKVVPHESDHVTANGEVIVPIKPSDIWPVSLLISRPFFSRIWIVQEIALAKEALVCCGTEELDWWLLNLATGYLMTSGYRALGNEAGFERFISISLTCHSVQAGPFSQLASNVSAVLGILQHYRLSGATDKHDKIYALLGVLKRTGVRLEISPDYSVETQRMYVDLARIALRSADNLDIFAIAHGRDKTLPSWAPDWSDDSPQPNLLLPLSTTAGFADQERKPYNASASSVVDKQNILQENRLFLRGFRHDVLVRVEAPFRWQDGAKESFEVNRASYQWNQTRQNNDPMPQNLVDGIRALRKIPLEFWRTMRQWHNLAVSKAFDPYPFTGETAETTLIRTMEGDHLPYGMEQPAKHWKHLWNSLEAAIQAGERIMDGSTKADDMRDFIAPAKLPENPKEWDKPLYGPGNRRCLARTRRGYLALVGQEAKEGDSIVLLQGGRTPYVARRKEESWTLVSDAYVHGLMYGEAWDLERCEDMVFV